MQKYRVVVLDKAEQIIRANFRYLADDFQNEPAAYTHTIDIYKKIKSLEIFPESHPIYEGYTDGSFRVARVRQYRIFYYVEKDSKVVYVVDIMHSHQSSDNLKLPKTFKTKG